MIQNAAAYGANANATAERPSSIVTDSVDHTSAADLWNALNAAASTGNTSLVNSLLGNGAEIDGDAIVDVIGGSQAMAAGSESDEPVACAVGVLAEIG